MDQPKRSNRKVVVVDGFVHHLPANPMCKEPVPNFSQSTTAPAPVAYNPQARSPRVQNVLQKNRYSRRRRTDFGHEKRSLWAWISRSFQREYLKWTPKAGSTNMSNPGSFRKPRFDEFAGVIDPLRSHPIARSATITSSGSQGEILLRIPSSNPEPMGTHACQIPSSHLTESYAWKTSFERAHGEKIELEKKLRDLDVEAEARISELVSIHNNKEHAAQTQQRVTTEAWNSSLAAEREKTSALEQQVKDLKAQIHHFENVQNPLITSGTQADGSFRPISLLPTYEHQLQLYSTEEARLIRFLESGCPSTIDQTELFLPCPSQPAESRPSRVPSRSWRELAPVKSAERPGTSANEGASNLDRNKPFFPCSRQEASQQFEGVQRIPDPLQVFKKLQEELPLALQISQAPRTDVPEIQVIDASPSVSPKSTFGSESPFESRSHRPIQRTPHVETGGAVYAIGEPSDQRLSMGNISSPPNNSRDSRPQFMYSSAPPSSSSGISHPLRVPRAESSLQDEDVNSHSFPASPSPSPSPAPALRQFAGPSRIVAVPPVFRRPLSFGTEEAEALSRVIGMGVWEWCSIPDLALNREIR